MEPSNNRFGGGVDASTMHPAIAFAVVIAIILMLVLKRRHLIAVFIPVVFLIPPGQVLVIMGLHFPVLRILTLIGCSRLVVAHLSSRKGALSDGFNRIDIALILWALFNALTFTLTWMATAALINRFGFLIDALGGYFLMRFAIQDEKDARRVIGLYAYIAVVMAASMIYEQATRSNLFWSFTEATRLDGSPMSLSEMREGRIRSQAVFQHPLLAGTYGAVFLPLFVSMWQKRKRALAGAGIVASLVMTIAAASSTPILTYLTGIVALCFWPFRKRTRLLRWATVIFLVGLHLVMRAPVWALISRIDVTGSSSSYHRYLLVDNFIKHFSDWWLIGAKDFDTWGQDMWDLVNQYVAYGATGGLATLGCFIAIIVFGFKTLAAGRKYAGKREWEHWCVTASLMATVVAYFGVSYDSQMQVAWYSLLAIISANAYSIHANRLAVAKQQPSPLIASSVPGA